MLRVSLWNLVRGEVECGPDSGPGAGAGTPDARLTRDRTGESKIIILTISFFCRYSIELTTAIYPVSGVVYPPQFYSRRRERRVGAICSTTTPAPTGKSLTPAHRRPRAGYRARDVPPRANELRDVPPLPVCRRTRRRARPFAARRHGATAPPARSPPTTHTHGGLSATRRDASACTRQCVARAGWRWLGRRPLATRPPLQPSGRSASPIALLR